MNLNLIPATPEHASLWWNWRQEAATRQHNPLKDAPVSELTEWLAASGSDLTVEKERYLWILNRGVEPVGVLSLVNWSREMGYAEIGYMLAESHHGQGVGRQAVELFVTKIFSETTLRKLIAYTSVRNLASWRLLERLGFVREGVLRDHYVILGQPVNEYLYGLLRSDFRRH